MSTPLLSIIMPVRNAAPFLEECLASIVKQSFSNYELIAVNDHSDDHSLEILQSYAKRFSQFKILSNKGRGIIDALNTAYAQAEGAFITRMDADDLMPPQKLQRLYNALVEKGENFVATGLVKYFKQGDLGEGYQKYEAWLNGLTSTSSNFEERYKECVIPSPCWMIHRADFERIGGFDSTIYPEDYDLAFRMFEGGLQVVGVNQICHLWRDHGGRASRNDTNYANNNFLDLKMRYFLKLDHDPKSTLVLWGAGQKGKYLAKSFLEKNINFHWVCDNPKKIGKDIYRKKLESISIIDRMDADHQFIIAVANGESQAQIKAKLKKKESFFFA